jgi:hypothetical protein
MMGDRHPGVESGERAWRGATRLRLRSRSATPEEIQAIVDALDAAAKTIERS